MNAKRLNQEIGMVDDALIARADTAEIQKVRRGKNHKWSRWGLLVACLALFLALGTTVYAASPAFRVTLADILHLKEKETTYIGLSTSSSGITMTVESAHVCQDTAVVMLTFQKNDGTIFGNGMNPSISLTDADGNDIFKSGLSGGVYATLSNDSKTLICYYTWSFPDSFTDRTVVLKVSRLDCNQSQVAGTVWPDDVIQGDWRIQFELTENTDHSKTIHNPDLSKTISVFDQEMQLDTVSLNDMLLIASTTTLNQKEITEQERKQRMLSNVFPGSSAYFDVFVQLLYKDGSMSEKVSFLRDSNGDMVAWFPETIPIADVSEIRIGDVTIPVK